METEKNKKPNNIKDKNIYTNVLYKKAPYFIIVYNLNKIKYL